MLLDPDIRDRIVYILFREDWTPFYVGKGEIDRPSDHFWEAKTGCTCYKCNIIRETVTSVGHVPTIVLAKDLTDPQTCAMESLLIAAIGRKDKGLGPLVNLTDGGDGMRGYVWSEETKRKHKETLSRPDVKVRQIQGTIDAHARPEVKEKRRRHFDDPLVKAKRSKSAKEAHARPEVKENQRRASKESNSRPEVREKISVSMVAVNADPEFKKKQRDGLIKKLNEPEVKARQSAGLKASNKKPEVIERRRNSAIAALAPPEVREKISKNTSKALNQPGVQDRRLEKYRQTLAKRKADPELQAAKLLKYKATWADPLVKADRVARVNATKARNKAAKLAAAVATQQDTATQPT